MSFRPWSLVLVLAALGVATVFVFGSPSQANDEDADHIVYLSVTGEGPNAKAWYKGAPPAGVPVQDALDHFAELGYHVSAVRAHERSVFTLVTSSQGVVQAPSEREEFFIILLERR